MYVYTFIYICIKEQDSKTFFSLSAKKSGLPKMLPDFKFDFFSSLNNIWKMFSCTN